MEMQADCTLNEPEWILILMLLCTVWPVAVWILVFHRLRAPAGKPILMDVCVVETSDQCLDACAKIKSHLDEYKILAIDAEWVTLGKTRQPVALLQLCTINGYCALVRLNKLRTVPEELTAILKDPNIVKVGIVPEQDALYLLNDHEIMVNSTFDLRFLYQCQYGLATLAEEELQITLDKRFHIRCSNWESENLTNQQKHYAAMDVYASMELFKKRSGLSQRTWKNMWMKPSWPTIQRQVSCFLGVKFGLKRNGYVAESGLAHKSGRIMNYDTKLQRFRRNQSNGKKVFYDNIQLQAPDGQLLCTLRDKACSYYLSNNLATLVSEEPKIIRLLFEPKYRNHADENLYEKELKQDLCVVCGSKTDLLKHYVVPACYRKLFPVKLKSHNSHDIVLLCFKCHCNSSRFTSLLMKKMNQEAGYRPSKEKQRTICMINMANALLYQESDLPEERKRFIEKELKGYLQVDELTVEVLLGVLKPTKTAPLDCPNQVVISYYRKDGRTLIDLIKIWRKHFLDTANPKFLPKHWSVDYHPIDWRGTEL